MTWQWDIEIKPSCMMTLRTCLFPKTLLPLTTHQWNTVCLKRIVHHPTNTVRTPPLPWSSWVAWTFLTTPGMTYPIGTYYQPTHAHWRIGTTHWQITATYHNTLTTSNPRPIEEPLHMAMEKYTDTLCTTQWQTSPHLYVKTSPHLMGETP